MFAANEWGRALGSVLAEFKRHPTPGQAGHRRELARLITVNSIGLARKLAEIVRFAWWLRI